MREYFDRITFKHVFFNVCGFPSKSQSYDADFHFFDNHGFLYMKIEAVWQVGCGCTTFLEVMGSHQVFGKSSY